MNISTGIIIYTGALTISGLVLYVTNNGHELNLKIQIHLFILGFTSCLLSNRFNLIYTSIVPKLSVRNLYPGTIL
eukprot:SAG11_NODE_17266_length_523_cov_1.334906_1_plen_74_part_01